MRTIAIAQPRLEQLYDEGVTVEHIASVFGCSRNTIARRLAAWEIPRRPRSKINGRKTGPVPRYISEEFLHRRYVVEEASSIAIAEELSVDSSTVRQWLRKCGIHVRDQHNCKPTNRVALTEELLEYLDGTLLGDGCLVADTELSAYYTISQKHRSYIEWVRAFLAGHGLEQMGAINSWKSPKSPNVNYRYACRYYRDLRQQYDRWYPGGVKRVPFDVRLTPLSVRAWFLEDGCWDRDHGVRFAACGFKGRGVEYLADELRWILDTPHIHTNERGYISFAREEIVRRFFEYILPLPGELAKDYGYKYDNRGRSN